MLEDLERRELRQACSHEAGHYAVHTRFGGVGAAEVRPNEAARIDFTLKAWRARYVIYANPGQAQISTEARRTLQMLPASRVPRRWRVVVGLAGFAAECMADGEADHGVIADLLGDAIFAGEISASDLAMIQGWNAGDVATTVRHLTAAWPVVLRTADALAEQARTAA